MHLVFFSHTSKLYSYEKKYSFFSPPSPDTQKNPESFKDQVYADFSHRSTVYT